MLEWKSIGELIKYLPGGALKRDDVKDTGLYPVMNGGIDYSGYYDDFNYDENVLTISHWGSSASHVHRHYGKFWANNACWVFVPQKTTECSLLYLYYILKNNESKMMKTMCFGGATPNLNRALFEKQKIPVPSFSEQQIIVEKLNVFTAILNKIDKEIELRKQQYDYYCNRLLKLEGKDVDYYTMGELFTFKNGLSKGKEYFGKGKPIIMFSNVFNSRSISSSMVTSKVDITDGELKRINAKVGDVFFTRTSETREDVGYASVLIEEIKDCTYAGFLIRARPTTDKLLPGYCKYCFSTPQIRSSIVSNSSFTTRASLTGGRLSNISIPVPTLNEQRSIVEKLDAFPSLISKLQEERDLRQKQYEYYRDKLLTFE